MGARRRAALGGALLALLALAFAAGRWTDGDHDRRTREPARDQLARPAPAAVRPPTLAVGLDSNDPAALTPPGVADAAPPAFEAARATVAAIAPTFVRVEVRWDLLQPDAAAPLDPARPTADGCARERREPCAAPTTLDATLRAVAAAQRARPGRFRLLLTFWGMPAWAGDPRTDPCGGGPVRDGARPLAAAREGDYRAAIRAVAAAAGRAGARIDGWTPWNEPNAPYFLGPQRATCAADAAPSSPAVYARMTRAMAAELAALRRSGAPPARLVLGELASWAAPSGRAVPADEFLRALPDDVLCRADMLSLHGYLEARPRTGRGEPVAAGLRELDRRRCLDGRPAWITETGVGAPHGGGRRDVRPRVLASECRLLHGQLERWYRDPRVTAAFQYSLREDRYFPVGLLDEGLRRTYPAAAVWEAWGGSRAPAAPPPPLPAACAAPAPAASAAPQPEG
ncbi:hypothetical protein [Patulibacter defluvii]|uniref:hypothetical protein n=1 Tax=Patulibacter defluvii TaxID=3095358 RepID=UPI002A762CB1|nr:hypothetical protein [Patulibacter sp. DM4]